MTAPTTDRTSRAVPRGRSHTIPFPVRTVGPVRLIGVDEPTEVWVPLATLETPLWPSVARGARATREAGGIHVAVVREGMTRSVLLEAPSALEAARIGAALQAREADLAQVATTGSRFARFQRLHWEVCGRLLFVRLELWTGDAAGHNMVTRAAQQVLDWMVREWPQLRAVSVSANYCTDKKVSAVNGLMGRGRFVVAECELPSSICCRILRSSPVAIEELNVRKNLLGSSLAGSLRSANAHFANMLLALYLATGQDAANIVEGSQGTTWAEAQPDSLYFSVTLPNVVVGTVGAGKVLPWVRQHLQLLGCTSGSEPGRAAQRLAMIAAAVVLCGELSLLAALTNPGELVRTHLRLERAGTDSETSE